MPRRTAARRVALRIMMDLSSKRWAGPYESEVRRGRLQPARKPAPTITRRSSERIPEADLHRPRLIGSDRSEEVGAVPGADRVGEVRAVQGVVDLPEHAGCPLTSDAMHVLQPQVEQHLVRSLDAVAD